MQKQLEVRNPYNGELISSVPLSDEDDLRRMLASAVAMKEKWARTPLHERSKILYRMADLMEAQAADIAHTLTLELGRTLGENAWETNDAINFVRGFVEKARHLYGDNLCTENQPGFENDIIITVREPLGVIFGVVPFNYPLELLTHKIAPALIMGNVVIVKAPTNNPLAALKVCSLFEEAGGPAGVLQAMVCDRHDSDKVLLESNQVQAVSLTGSTSSGIEVARSGAKNLKHIFLELGGNDPLIILEDADLDYAVEEMVVARVSHAGQACSASKRFLVQRSIAEPLAAKLVERLKKIKIGDPMDESVHLGTLASKAAADLVMKQIQHTVDQGAKLIFGGERLGEAVVSPAVLTGVTRDMDVAVDMEIFGPVFPFIAFDTDEEALEIANATAYGLSSGIVTDDFKRSMRLAMKIKAGAVAINGQGNYRHMDQAFGGYKMTGLGREGISCTLEEVSQVKSIIMKGILDK